MKKCNQILIVFLATFQFLFSCSEKNKFKSKIINCKNNVTVYYPPSYNLKAHNPSFAIIKEPTELSKNSDSNKISVDFSSIGDRALAQVVIGENVDLYGTGEVMGDLIRNGKNIKLWNTDNYAYGKDHGQRLYQSHPWVLGVREDGSSFGVIADNTWKMEISLGERISFLSEGPAFRVIIIEKESPQVMKELGNLTGKIALPPLWSLGFPSM